MCNIEIATIDNIIARVEALDALRLSDGHPMSTKESLVNILTTTYTPPVFEFFHHANFKYRPHYSFNDEK